MVMKSLTAKRVEEVGGKAATQFDFTDDGSHFKMYVIDGVPISCLRACGQTYLSLRSDYIKSFNREGLTDLKFNVPYSIWKETATYKLEWKYNGCESFEMDELLADIKAFREGIIEAQVAFDNLEVPVGTLSSKLRAEATCGRAVVDYWKQNFDWFNASNYEVNRLRDYAKNFLEYCERAEGLASEVDNGTLDKEKLYELSNRQTYLVVDLGPNSFYKNELEVSLKAA